MANFIALIDPDTDRRNRFLRQATPLVPPIAGLSFGSCSAPPFSALWAVDPHAPISVESSECATVIFGTAIRGKEGLRLDAKELRALWHGGGAKVPEPFDGYYAALVYDPRQGLLAGADILGRFPLYYFSSGEVVLIGSSPELFQHHPSFSKAFDPLGLAGILLTNGVVEGRTLWQGVRRLGPGYLLAASTGEPPREIRQYELPSSDRYFNQPSSKHVDILYEALDDAVRRHVPPTPRPILMLSGGMDSRTIAGFLARQVISPLAVTHGDRRDIEMQCAVKVARRLRFQHHASESDSSHFLPGAERRIRWDHCCSGFSGTGGWGSAGSLRPFGTTAVSGYSMDWVVGGFASNVADLSFEKSFDYHNRWGLRPEVLERLLRREVFGDSVRDVMAALQARYQSYSDLEFRRAWGFALHHRQRFHISSHAWAESFGAWPIVPAVDMNLLEVASGISPTSLEYRRLQIDLLCRRFPELASLPLDRNSYNMAPLLPGFGWRLRHFVRRRALRMYRSMVPEGAPREERRRYFRQYDINSPGWRSVREIVEPLRRLGHEYFNPAVLDELVPPPQAQITFADGITGAAGMKSILGFLLWLGRRANGATRAP